MNKRKIAVGPGASSLILIAVVLALSVLTVLTMISARSDEALATRSAETREEVYGLFADGERSLAKLDAIAVSCLAENPEDPDAYYAAVKENLPYGMKMKENAVSWTEKRGDRSLECAVRVNEPGAESRITWTKHALAAGDIWEEDGFDDFDDWGDEDEDEGFEEDEESGEDVEAGSGDEELTEGEEEAPSADEEETTADGEEDFE